MFSDPYVCTIVITHAIYSINIVYTKLQSLNKSVKSVKDKYSNLKALSYYYKGKTNTQKEKIAVS